MALKRKLSLDFDDAIVRSDSKQPKLVPFPNTESDSDVAMSDDLVPELSPLAIPAQLYHTRLPSNASSLSSEASDSASNSPYYPTFQLYPHEAQDEMAVDTNYFNSEPSPKRVGLLQPKGSSFTHHGDHCSQIPKLRMACSSGPGGRRTMWAHCEQCGAIEMVDTD